MKIVDTETKKYIDSKVSEIIDSGNNNFRKIEKDIKMLKFRLKKFQ